MLVRPYCLDKKQEVAFNQTEALCLYKDFEEILQSEVNVDLERLRILARQGIPNELRGVLVSLIV